VTGLLKFAAARATEAAALLSAGASWRPREYETRAVMATRKMTVLSLIGLYPGRDLGYVVDVAIDLHRRSPLA
jgi:hypothetical protein